MTNWRVANRLARRELRSGIRGFWVLLACLALGVASIAAVGTVRSNIENGLSEQGAALLGGDAEIELTYRFADDEEFQWMHENSIGVSEIIEFRSMAVTDSGDQIGRALTQLKGVDDLYPLTGEIQLDPPIALAKALAERDGVHGAVMHGDLINRLQIGIGDQFSLGKTLYQLNARLAYEPDGVNTGFALGPRTIVHADSLQESGLVGPGTLFSTKYRLKLSPEIDLEVFETETKSALAESGLQWTDRRNGSPSARAFVQRVGAFLVLVGLAGIAVGGVGVAAAVRVYLESKIKTIATLKTLGATRHTIFLTYLLQIGVMIALGVAIGIALGASLPWLFEPLLSSRLPVPIRASIPIQPLAEAALYGTLAGLAFSLWSLSKTGEIKAAELYRIGSTRLRRIPPPALLLSVIIIASSLVVIATLLSGAPRIAIWATAGIVASLIVLGLAASAIRLMSRALARSGAVRGRTGLRLAIGSVGGPNSDAESVILALGLGLTVIATVGQISANLNHAIINDIPEQAPTYFVIDIQNTQFDSFVATAQPLAGVKELNTAPMLRGIISQINGINAIEAAGTHWVLRGDRGISYATAPPEDTVITEGKWWPDNYSGTPLVSFADEEARELGLNIGDVLTLNILGREIDATIANFRQVEFETIGIGFIMIMNPTAIAGAPHTHIATIYADDDQQQNLFRTITSNFPNVTVISVKEGIARFAEILNGLAAAITYGSGSTLATGLIVLIGAAAAGERRRVYESSIMKTLGASRARILASLALRSAILGAGAGTIAIIAGGIAGWAVMTFAMEADYQFEPVSAVAIVFAGGLVSLIAGLLFALAPLNASPSRVLRSPD